jgi:hypothetical protein
MYKSKPVVTKPTKCADCFNLHKVIEEDKKVNPKQMFKGYKPPGKKTNSKTQRAKAKVKTY